MTSEHVRLILNPEEGTITTQTRNWVAGYILALKDTLRDIERLDRARLNVHADYNLALSDIREQVENSLIAAEKTLDLIP